MGSPAASADVQPAGRSLLERRFQIAPDPACQLPAAALERVQLVQAAAVAVDDQRVPVGAALDADVRGDRVRAAIALVGVVERHPGLRL